MDAGDEVEVRSAEGSASDVEVSAVFQRAVGKVPQVEIARRTGRIGHVVVQRAQKIGADRTGHAEAQNVDDVECAFRSPQILVVALEQCPQRLGGDVDLDAERVLDVADLVTESRIVAFAVDEQDRDGAAGVAHGVESAPGVGTRHGRPGSGEPLEGERPRSGKPAHGAQTDSQGPGAGQEPAAIHLVVVVVVHVVPLVWLIVGSGEMWFRTRCGPGRRAVASTPSRRRGAGRIPALRRGEPCSRR